MDYQYVVRTGGVNGKSALVTPRIDEALQAVATYLKNEDDAGVSALGIEIRRVLTEEEAMAVVRGHLKNMSESVAEINKDLQAIQGSFGNQVEAYKHLTESMEKVSAFWHSKLRKDLLEIEKEMGDDQAWK